MMKGAIVKIKPTDKKRYVLAESRDYKILAAIYLLEKCKLSLADKKIVTLISSQLERDWRKPLMVHLTRLIKKYRA